MGQFDLNLSTRPFKAYRAANLGMFSILLVLIGLSVFQFYNYQQYSSLAASIRDEERKAKQASETLTKEQVELNKRLYTSSAAQKLAEVEFLNELLARKSFSWTKVFANLERVLPENVHMLAIRPFVDEKGKVGLNMAIRGKTIGDATEFVRALETSRIFDDVAVAVEDKRTEVGTEVEFSLSAYYYPERAAE